MIYFEKGNKYKNKHEDFTTYEINKINTNDEIFFNGTHYSAIKVYSGEEDRDLIIELLNKHFSLAEKKNERRND